ncbi:HAD-IA family hydrolase [Paenibacillus taichungensis]|uniref:HAD-IA family hydrolase n=1 Tax=Paenibacillus taichungensis TaxID=484184 RepID=UPI0028713AF7|nr:HAD-IA family hydrolase [Paenibacillus taichungensis]MDR9746258.1 HAD-IA family hydrolase [Paenibacillus taichungensis]
MKNDMLNLFPEQHQCMEIETLVFDILGTLVDEDGTLNREVVRILSHYGIEHNKAQTVADDWNKQNELNLHDIAVNKKSFISKSEISLRSLTNVLQVNNISLDTSDFEHLLNIGNYYEPWPEVPRQLTELTHLVRTIGLTNSGLDNASNFNYWGNLRWHGILSTQLIRTYKPASEAYEFAINTFNLTPRKTLFVAAHPWDLRAAASHGFQTAYIPRKYAGAPEPNDRFNYHLDSLDDLIKIIKIQKGI